MPHEIGATDGAVYAVRSAWHGLGTTFPRHLTAREAKEIALPWDVYQVPVGIMDSEQDDFHASDEFSATVRNDNHVILGITSPIYNPFTNEQLIEAIERIYGASAEVIESMFSIKGGKRVIALVNLAQANVKLLLQNSGGGFADDPHAAYHAFSNAHTGKEVGSIFPTMVRIVCKNTWNLAAGYKGENIVRDGVKIRHSSLQAERWAAAVEAYRQAAILGEMSTKTIQKLALSTISNKNFRALKDSMIDWALPPEKNKTANGLPTLRERRREELHKDLEEATKLTFATYNESPTAENVNAYLALNAITLYSEHELGYKGTELERKENEFESRLFGKAADWREKAFFDLSRYAELSSSVDTTSILKETADRFSYISPSSM